MGRIKRLHKSKETKRLCDRSQTVLATLDEKHIGTELAWKWIQGKNLSRNPRQGEVAGGSDCVTQGSWKST